jgi:hypothetical protein
MEPNRNGHPSIHQGPTGGNVKTLFNWRHQYDTDRDTREGDAVRIECLDESLTQQHFTEEADVNTIARRFGLDKGPLPNVPINPNHYGDLSNVPDLRTALDITRDAVNKFMELPPKLRARFHNKPDELWDFVIDPDNAEESVRLGLLTRPPDPQNKGPAEPAPQNTP